MKLNKLDKTVLKLWYIKALIAVCVMVGAFIAAIVVLSANSLSSNAVLAVSLSAGIPIGIATVLVLVWPRLRYNLFSYGYDEKTIVVNQGVIFRRRVVIPVCQIQDLHRFEGPIMMLLKLSGVTISTAGSNFNLTTLTTAEADTMIDELERQLEVRIEVQKNEEI